MKAAHVKRSPFVAVLTAGIALTIAVVLAGCAPAGSTAAPAGDSAGSLTGTTGAANFDAGYLEVGTGPRVVDVYLDLMCPYCNQFETANAELLRDLTADGTITVRIHTMTFLDRLSQGSAYSTRAAGALVSQATLNPDATLPFLAALFANQPDENTSGLTDDDLVQLAADSAGASGASIADDVAANRYAEWTADVTTAATAEGGVDGADITAIKTVPTVLVDGVSYSGGVDDPEAFRDFLDVD